MRDRKRVTCDLLVPEKLVAPPPEIHIQHDATRARRKQVPFCENTCVRGASPQTIATVAAHDPVPEMRTIARMSAWGPRIDQWPQSPRRGCERRSSSLAKATHLAAPCNWRRSTERPQNLASGVRHGCARLPTSCSPCSSFE